jgi:hypothetical protein
MTQESKQTRQTLWLKAFRAKLFNISAACRDIGIDRSTYYKWLDDPEFTEAVHDAREEKIDFIESRLLNKIKEGDTTAIIFALKTLAKSRGYVERREISGPEGRAIPSVDVKILLQNPESRMALETIARQIDRQEQKAVECTG